MMIQRFFIILLFVFISKLAVAQQARVIKMMQLEELLNYKNDTTYVINFWATWCKPCVNELPGFLAVESENKNNKVRFIFISLDFKRELDSRLNTFLKNKNMSSDVFLLDEPDYNKWINLVETTWEGNIPGTLIYNKTKNIRNFYPKELSREELEKAIQLH
jgi:thiol-disulfide isomerase/thioredoxin